MSDIPTRPKSTTQSVRNIRISDIRNVNILDREVIVSDDWTDTDAPLQAGGIWSRAINVKGYDSIILFVDHTVGGTTALGEELTLSIDIQSGFDPRCVDDAEWYDRYTSFNLINGDTTLIVPSNTITLDTSTEAIGAEIRIFLELRSIGHYMRFRPYVTTATAAVTERAGSRIYIRAVRDLS